MRVERSTVDQIKAKFASLKRKQEQPVQEYGKSFINVKFPACPPLISNTCADLEKRVQQIKREEEADKIARKQEKKERKQKAKEEAATTVEVTNGHGGDLEIHHEMSSMMGFGGFGSSKKK